MVAPLFSLDFPRAYGAINTRASFRSLPEDFQVTEELGFEPVGEGEHVYLYVEKKGENTAWVAEQIARIARVKPMDIGYCGRKDRHAITRQWFSVYLPMRNQDPEPDWAVLNTDSINIIKISRHVRKLRKGEHQANHFAIRLRDVQTDDIEALNNKIEKIFVQGVPNYFGEQRFGHKANNLREAQALLVEGKQYRDKQKRGLVLSAARSYLFNLVLAERVRSGNWDQILKGDPEPIASGPLWGRGRPLAFDELLVLEQAVLSPWNLWCHSLEHMGLNQERRALVLRPSAGKYQWHSRDCLELGFTLEAGAFATSVLAELCVLENRHQVNDTED